MPKTLFILALFAAIVFPAQNADIVGTWEMTTNSPEGTTMNEMVVSKDGDKLRALARSERGQRPYDSLEVSGNKVTIVLTIDYQGSPMVITYTGKIDKATMSGDADFGGLAQGTWSAER